MTRTTMTSLCAAALLAMTTVACSNSNDRADEAAREAERAAERATEAARDAGEEAREAGREAGRAIERAAEATATAGRDAAAAAGAAIETADVKLALTADARVDASRIDVDTDQGKKTITLKGKVGTPAQKALAGDIAEAKAPGYTIKNDLTVDR